MIYNYFSKFNNIGSVTKAYFCSLNVHVHCVVIVYHTNCNKVVK